jgi:hypothetical protein
MTYLSCPEAFVCPLFFSLYWLQLHANQFNQKRCGKKSNKQHNCSQGAVREKTTGAKEGKNGLSLKGSNAAFSCEGGSTSTDNSYVKAKKAQDGNRTKNRKEK